MGHPGCGIWLQQHRLTYSTEGLAAFSELNEADEVTVPLAMELRKRNLSSCRQDGYLKGSNLSAKGWREISEELRESLRVLSRSCFDSPNEMQRALRPCLVRQLFPKYGEL